MPRDQQATIWFKGLKQSRGVFGIRPPDFKYPELHASASRGCTTCCAIMAVLTAETSQPQAADMYWAGGALVAEINGFDSSAGATETNVVFDLQLVASQDHFLSFAEVRAIHPELEMFTTSVVPSNVQDSPLKRSAAVIRGWLDRCADLHGGCRSEDEFFPRRTLLLQDDGTAHVVERDEVKDYTSTPYACLSRRWSKRTGEVSLTADRMASYTTSIDIAHLPILFRDAIAVTLSLGLRHIWIDSLCIIQDSAKDWMAEASAMASIYENATFTIGATSCNGCEESLFQQQPLPTSTQITTWRSNPVTLRPRVPHPWSISRSQGYMLDLGSTQEGGDFSLLNRGWVFQEHILSQRYIHFGKHELLFECCEAIWCECQSLAAHNNESLRMFPQSQRLANWPDVVETYKNLSLTYEKDRLPALAGAAKRHQSLFRGTYIAGHWFNKLGETLLWYSAGNKVDPGEKPSRQGTASLPSWCWASTNRPVLWGPVIKDEVEFISCHQNPQVDPYMTGQSAAITIRGSLVEATLHHGSDWKSLFVHPEDLEFPLWSDAAIAYAGVQIGSLPTLLPIFADYDFKGPGFDSVPSGSPVMLLLCSPHRGGDNEDHPCLVGIVLRQVSDLEKQYERIGFFLFAWEDRIFPEPWEDVERLRSVSTSRTITLI